ncbi:MAG: isocitrate/isopropylmalate family dehydrogenase, partial [Pseudomonadales bacterium]|nr:isocitrate/isopropylmalate family dehydrogenase [Pseudomonadales bacterium]
MSVKQVSVFLGDDASPEVMEPTIDIVESMNLGLTFNYPLIGAAAEQATGSALPAETKQAIDEADATLFGSTSGNSTSALFYLRWGKQTFANVRPCIWQPG